MKNYYILITSLILFLILSFSNVFAANVNVQINGEIVDFTDSQGNVVEAQIVNSRTMVPLRKIFEILGCELEWNGETKAITARKENKVIELQVDNKVASKNINGKEDQILLDTPPIIKDNRTLVPLRFIAESLEKQVGWDNVNRTAIIIDYDYFTEMIKENNEILYNFLVNENGNTNFKITKSYFDKSNEKLNTVGTLNGKISDGDMYFKNVTLEFSGNDPLILDIISENWNKVSFGVKGEEDKFKIITTDDILAKILDINANENFEISLKELEIEGNTSDNYSKYIQEIFNISEKQLTINTFENMKKDFQSFIELFVKNGTRTLTFENTQLKTFDYLKMKNRVYNNNFIKTLIFINQKVFGYEVDTQSLYYDWNKINYSIDSKEGKTVIKIAMENEYKEKIEYKIEF